MTAFSLITVIHDSRDDLERLLKSLHRLPTRPELVVVDSGSADGGLDLARDAGAKAIALEGNPGFGAGCNAGLAQASEPLVALVNPDVELLDGGLARLAHVAATGPPALLAPRLINTDGSVQDSAHPLPGSLGGLLAAPVPRALLPAPLRLRLEPWRSDHQRVVGWAVGACVVAQARVLRELGPFDPAAFLFYEDLELCLRARAAGVPTVLRPDVAVRHAGGTSTGPALGGHDLALRARRRREVIRREGRVRGTLDDAEQALTFASRAAGKRFLGRGGQRELARLGALRDARGRPR